MVKMIDVTVEAAHWVVAETAADSVEIEIGHS